MATAVSIAADVVSAATSDTKNIESLKTLFEKSIYVSKFGFVFLLMGLAILNGHNSHIKRHPKRFVFDILVIPATVCLATAFMAWNRHSTILDKTFITFLFFFLFQVFRELSGYYAFMGHGEITPQEKKQTILPTLLAAGIITFVTSLFLFGLSLQINQPFPLGTHVSFLYESIVVVILLTAGEAAVSATHDDHNILVNTVAGLLAISMFQVTLQKGGFYDKVFVPE